MDLSQERFDHIVNLIYDTLDDKRGWRAVLDSLNQATGARAIHLLAFDAAHGSLSYSDGAGMAPQVDLEYIQTYQFIDPRVRLMRARRSDEWMHCHEHFDEAFVARDPFYQEFLIPHGARYLSACKLIENSAATVILACLGGAESGPFPPQVVAFVERLRPHLSRACRIGMAHFVYTAQALVGHALVNKLRQPVMLLATTGEVVLANQAATRLLQSTRLVKVEGGRLVLPATSRKAFFERCAALEAIVRSGAGAAADDLGFSSLHMASTGAAAPEVLYGFFTMLVPEQVLGSSGLRPLVMLYFYHPTSAQAIDASLLAAAFGLSHAECRIASLLVDGMPLKTIADSIGVQYDTVRKQLLSIYQKTATNRQPELVRLLLHLPAASVQRGKAAAAIPCQA